MGDSLPVPEDIVPVLVTVADACIGNAKGDGDNDGNGDGDIGGRGDPAPDPVLVYVRGELKPEGNGDAQPAYLNTSATAIVGLGL